MYNIQFYYISYLRNTDNQTTLTNSPYFAKSPFPIIPILISSDIHSTFQQTTTTRSIYTLCAFRRPHFTISKIPFSYYTSLSPSLPTYSLFILHLTLSLLTHILIAARLHVLRRQTQ